MRKYLDDEHKYIQKIYKGKSVKEITRLFNNKFHRKRTESQIKSYLNNRKMKTGSSKGRVAYGSEIVNFVQQNVKQFTDNEISSLINKKFDLNTNESTISNLKTRHGIKSGVRRGLFKKGSVPANKGKTWDEFMSKEGQEKSRKTTFKKGNIPSNLKDVGYERICSKDGHVIVKVQNEGSYGERWEAKHRMIYEQVNGPIPKGNVITFLDGDNLNSSIDNLMMLTKSQNAVLNKNNLRVDGNVELTKFGISLSSLILKASHTKIKTKEKSNDS